MIWQTISTSSAETERLGEQLGKYLKGGEVIELRSDLGGGKTTFVRGLVRGAGSSDRVASPTFTLSKVYKAKDLTIYHFDFYRLNEPGVMSEQLAEILSQPDVITVVEWGDIVQDVLPQNRLSILFEPSRNNPDERLVAIRYPGSKQKLVSELQTVWQEVRP